MAEVMVRTSKLLQKLEANYPDKISKWYRDKSGYHINLKKGWQWRDSHTIHETTVEDALSAFYSIRRCDCNNCKT
jgi:hypothetical protein